MRKTTLVLAMVLLPVSAFAQQPLEFEFDHALSGVFPIVVEEAAILGYMSTAIVDGGEPGPAILSLEGSAILGNIPILTVTIWKSGENGEKSLLRIFRGSGTAPVSIAKELIENVYERLEGRTIDIAVPDAATGEDRALASWPVSHDHTFGPACVGVLYLDHEQLRYEADDGEHGFSLSYEDIEEYEVNKYQNTELGEFHVKAEQIGNYNFRPGFPSPIGRWIDDEVPALVSLQLTAISHEIVRAIRTLMEQSFSDLR